MATIQCVRCGRTAEEMTSPPTGGKTGQLIMEQVCADCWNEWKGQSVAVINHYGLVLADPDHRAQLTRIMKEFLNLPES
jgi:Fe-S cluster biosynthesis and repair protein YggX